MSVILIGIQLLHTECPQDSVIGLSKKCSSLATAQHRAFSIFSMVVLFIDSKFPMNLYSPKTIENEIFILNQ
jgi:hypothetical protein